MANTNERRGHPGALAWKRTEKLDVRFLPGEMADIGAIAEAWDVGRTTVVWALIADYLARLRKRELIDLPLGHNATKILHSSGYFDRTRPVGGPRTVGENLSVAREVLEALQWSGREERCPMCSRTAEEKHADSCKMRDALSGARGRYWDEVESSGLESEAGDQQD
jgi:hypothetical protein